MLLWVGILGSSKRPVTGICIIASYMTTSQVAEIAQKISAVLRILNIPIGGVANANQARWKMANSIPEPSKFQTLNDHSMG